MPITASRPRRSHRPDDALVGLLQAVETHHPTEAGARSFHLSRYAGEVAERSDAGEGRLITFLPVEPRSPNNPAFAASVRFATPPRKQES